MSSCVVRTKKCFGEYKDDRLCEICELVRPEAYDSCKELHTVKTKMDEFLHNTEINCPFRSIGKVGTEPYCNCTLNNKNTGKMGLSCDVALKCYKYSRYKGKLEKIICPDCKQVAVWNPEGRNFVCTECSWKSKSFKVLNQE